MYLSKNEQPEGGISTDLNLLPKEKGIARRRPMEEIDGKCCHKSSLLGSNCNVIVGRLCQAAAALPQDISES